MVGYCAVDDYFVADGYFAKAQFDAIEPDPDAGGVNEDLVGCACLNGFGVAGNDCDVIFLCGGGDTV